MLRVWCRPFLLEGGWQYSRLVTVSGGKGVAASSEVAARIALTLLDVDREIARQLRKSSTVVKYRFAGHQ
jgi:hypothetical protein